MTTFAKRIIIIGLLMGFIFTLHISGLFDYFTLEQLKMHYVYFKHMIQVHYYRSIFVYLLAYIGVVTCSLPLAAVLTIAGGFLFGPVLGTLLTNIGATIGATFAFLLFRYLIGAALQRRYKHQLESFNQAMAEYGTSYLLMVHFIPVIPLFLINFLASCTTVNVWTFIWTTSVGIIPGSFVYAFAGQQLNTIESMKDVFSGQVLLAFLLLIVLAIAPMVIRRLRHNKV